MISYEPAYRPDPDGLAARLAASRQGRSDTEPTPTASPRAGRRPIGKRARS